MTPSLLIRFLSIIRSQSPQLVINGHQLFVFLFRYICPFYRQLGMGILFSIPDSMKTIHTDGYPKQYNYRKFLLLTLSGADATPDRASLSQDQIVSRITPAIPHCISIIVSKEEISGQGHYYFRVGILLDEGLHRMSAYRAFRKLFPEFEGDRLNVSFQRAWVTICEYIMKVDPTPFTWGQHSMEQILEIVKAQAHHRKSPLKRSSIPRKLKDSDAEYQSKVADAGDAAEVSCDGHEALVSDARCQSKMYDAVDGDAAKVSDACGESEVSCTSAESKISDAGYEAGVDAESQYLIFDAVEMESQCLSYDAGEETLVSYFGYEAMMISYFGYEAYSSHSLERSSLSNSKEKDGSPESPILYYRDQEFHLHERFYIYLSSAGWPAEYTIDYLKEIYSYLDWIAVNLIFNRPIGSKQLLLYGRGYTPISTLVFQLLSKVLYIYNYNATTNDYTGAYDDYDLWLFVHEIHDLYGSFHFDRDLTSSAKQTLFRVLDGKECRLMAGGDRVFTKRRTTPIVWISNNYSLSLKENAPLNERFVHLRCENWVSDLRADRLIATLWGCIRRRLLKEGVTWNNAKNIPINHVQ